MRKALRRRRRLFATLHDRFAARFFLFDFHKQLFGSMLCKFNVGHEISAKALGNSRAFELTLRMTGGSGNDQFVVAAF